jgi:hypothetical protein
MSDVTPAAAAPAPTSSSRWRRVWDVYLRHLAAREDAAALAAVRIGIGLSVLMLVVPFVVTDAGRAIVTFALCDVDFGGYRSLRGSTVLRWLGGPRPEVMQGLLMTASLAASLMVVGLGGRLSVLLVAVSTHLVFSVNADVSGGGDALLGNALFLLMLGNCTQTLSVDARLRTGHWIDPTPVAAWPRKLMLVQLAVVYTVTGLQKLVSSAWTPLDGFSALYQILQSPQWARDPDLIVWTDGWLVVPAAILSVVTIVWEVGFFTVLFSRRWRWLFAVTGVLMHAGILVLMEVGAFSWLSMALYPAMFADEVAALVAKARRR